MPQILNAWLGEGAFGCFGVELMLTKNAKHSAQVLDVSLQCVTVDKNVIQKGNDILTVLWREDGIHDTLECWGSIGDPERHHPELKMAVMCLEGHLRFISFPQPNFVIARAQVNLGEKGRARKFIQQFVNDWQRKLVLDGNYFCDDCNFGKVPLLSDAPTHLITTIDLLRDSCYKLTRCRSFANTGCVMSVN